MKYLKTNEGLFSKDIIDELKDILIELDDEGYETFVRFFPNGNKKSISPHEDIPYNYFVGIHKLEDNSLVQDKLDRIESFMRGEGYSMYMESSFQGNTTLLYFTKMKANEAKKIDQSENFIGTIDDIFVELKEKGFIYRVAKKETTYNIIITYRDRSEENSFRSSYFHWKDVKDTIIMMVNYLSDIYPKLNFNEFKANLISRSKGGRRVKWNESGVKAYTLSDFISRFNDTDTLDSIELRCLVRFRGKYI